MNIFSCSFYWLVFITRGLKNRASEGAAEEMAGERGSLPPLPWPPQAAREGGGWGDSVDVGGLSRRGSARSPLTQTRSCPGPKGMHRICLWPWGPRSSCCSLAPSAASAAAAVNNLEPKGHRLLLHSIWHVLGTPYRLMRWS